jgi:hypothetical protein
MLGYCRGCQRHWASRAEAHCSNCHDQFSSTGVFDMHMRAGGDCIPAKHVRHAKTGDQLLEPVQRAYGKVWRRYADPDAPRPDFWRARG